MQDLVVISAEINQNYDVDSLETFLRDKVYGKAFIKSMKKKGTVPEEVLNQMFDMEGLTEACLVMSIDAAKRLRSANMTLIKKNIPVGFNIRHANLVRTEDMKVRTTMINDYWSFFVNIDTGQSFRFDSQCLPTEFQEAGHWSLLKVADAYAMAHRSLSHHYWLLMRPIIEDAFRGWSWDGFNVLKPQDDVAGIEDLG